MKPNRPATKIQNKVDNANISVKVDKDVKTENKQ